MIILGINAFHPDSSACLLIDGEMKIALEEERINRIKHWSGLPIGAIKECLKTENIEISDIDFVSINSNFFSNFLDKIRYVLFNTQNTSNLIDKIKNKNQKKNIINLISENLGKKFKKSCKIISTNHHISHLSSAYFDSNFDDALNVSVDAFGDFASFVWGKASKDKVNIDGQVLFPHSLGIFYEAFTQYLGFRNYGDEYKMMGLSSYGKPTEVKLIKNIIKEENGINFKLNLKYFNHHKKNISYGWNNAQPIQKTLFSNEINKLIGPPRLPDEVIVEKHKNLASSVQYVYEEILFSLLNKIYEKFKVSKLTLSGGCAQNSLANGKIIKHTGFDSLFIPPNPGDAGGAIGAAYYAWYKIKKIKPKLNQSPYLGMDYSNKYIENLIKQKTKHLKDRKFNFFYLDESSLYKFVANSIAESKVVGWYQGKMEWGPRALGNRSILADPRNPKMKEILNLKIKKRESFRPFAPSILIDDAKEWFEDYIDEEPYMSRVLKFKLDKIEKIPAVVHIDGSGRIHTVKKEINPRFFNLIKTFKEITNIPIILNTSFNENEPIVNKPEEALDCFDRTNMDTLVLDNWIISRDYQSY